MARTWTYGRATETRPELGAEIECNARTDGETVAVRAFVTVNLPASLSESEVSERASTAALAVVRIVGDALADLERPQIG